MRRHVRLLAIALMGLNVGMAFPSVGRGNDSSDRFALPEKDDGLRGAGPIRRADWFRNIWLTRRAGFAREEAAKQGAVVFFRDSVWVLSVHVATKVASQLVNDSGVNRSP